MTCLQFWLLIAQAVLAASVAVLVPLITFRHNKRLKEMEVRDREKDREFQITKGISAKAIKVMEESYHLTHKINRALNEFGDASEERRKEIYESVFEAREYWEKNLFYLPHAARRRIIPLTNISFHSMRNDPRAWESLGRAIDEVSEMFKNIEVAFADIMKKYNMFDYSEDPSTDNKCDGA